MPNPFIKGVSGFEIPHLREYVEWLVRRTDHPKKDVVTALKEFLNEVGSRLREQDLTPRAFDLRESVCLLEGMT